MQLSRHLHLVIEIGAVAQAPDQERRSRPLGGGHHQIEAVFKAFARALRVACAKDKRLAKMLPSTKGLL